MLHLLALASLAEAAPYAAPVDLSKYTLRADPDAAAAAEPAAPEKKRSFLMEVNFRGRYMTVPREILSPFLDDHDGEGRLERPDLNAYTLGLEFVVKEKSANGIFYLEYVQPMIEAGYWDDADRGSPDPLDGSWIEPNNFALIALGADYAYELHANNWLSFMFGAGLGLGIVLGDLYEWQPGEDPTDPEANNNNTEVDCGTAPMAAYDRSDPDKADCAYDAALVADGDMPPVLPFVDINIGVRFNISNRAAIRLEGGLHNMFYGGAAIGVVF